MRVIPMEPFPWGWGWQIKDQGGTKISPTAVCGTNVTFKSQFELSWKERGKQIQTNLGGLGWRNNTEKRLRKAKSSNRNKGSHLKCSYTAILTNEVGQFAVLWATRAACMHDSQIKVCVLLKCETRRNTRYCSRCLSDSGVNSLVMGMTSLFRTIMALQRQKECCE